jgi:hypothetical protein
MFKSIAVYFISFLVWILLIVYISVANHTVDFQFEDVQEVELCYYISTVGEKESPTCVEKNNTTDMNQHAEAITKELNMLNKVKYYHYDLSDYYSYQFYSDVKELRFIFKCDVTCEDNIIIIEVFDYDQDRKDVYITKNKYQDDLFELKEYFKQSIENEVVVYS